MANTGRNSKLGSCYVPDVFLIDRTALQIEIDCCCIPINCIPIGR